jgi:hypothetical protein
MGLQFIGLQVSGLQFIGLQFIGLQVTGLQVSGLQFAGLQVIGLHGLTLGLQLAGTHDGAGCIALQLRSAMPRIAGASYIALRRSLRLA